MGPAQILDVSLVEIVLFNNL